MHNTRRKAAFFDIDGTLVKGFIICAFPEYLSKNGFFDHESNKRIRELILQYKKGEIDASFAAQEIPREYARGIKGQNKENISNQAVRFMKEYEKNVFPYAKQLVELMNENGFLTIAMSGSPIEAIEKLDFLGFKGFYGSEMSVVSGTYDGTIRMNLVTIESKSKLLDNLIQAQNIDIDSSFGFGDTEQDAPMLTKVRYPVAVNPNNELRKIAEQKGWTICDKNDVIQKIIKILNSDMPIR